MLKLVSVLMPVKNEETHILEALNSVLKQSYSNVEIIVVNDGSKDRTSEIVSSIDDPKIKLINTEGVGKNSAFNLAYENATGDFYCCFAGDDVMPEDSIKFRVSAFKEPAGVAQVVLSKLKMFSNNKKYDGVVVPKKSEGGYSGGTMMFSKKTMDLIFPLPTSLANEDMWMTLIVKNFKVTAYHEPKVTLKYRIHDFNSSSKTGGFKPKTESMHKRFIVYGVFLERYRSVLNENQKSYLAAMSSAETLRYQNNWLPILFLSKISLSEKLRFIFHSTAFLYWIRIKLFSFFSGR